MHLHHQDRPAGDCHGILDIDRHRKIDVDARSPSEVYRASEEKIASANTEFLRMCIANLPKIRFVDRDSRSVCAWLSNGSLERADHELLKKLLDDDNSGAAFDALCNGDRERLFDCAHQQAIELEASATKHLLGLL